MRQRFIFVVVTLVILSDSWLLHVDEWELESYFADLAAGELKDAQGHERSFTYAHHLRWKCLQQLGDG